MREEYSFSTVNEILFLDDFFRCSENGLKYSWENRRTLRALFEGAATRMGWIIREASPRSSGGDVIVTDVMEQLGLTPGPEGWARATIADLTATSLHNVLGITPATLVIGWGMPSSLLRYIDARHAKFLDCELHWVRFARNLQLLARTNDPALLRRLEQLRIEDEMFWAGAASLKARFARNGPANYLSKNSTIGIFAGQMEIDLALVQEGIVAKPEDYIEQIGSWAQEVDLLVICPHPAMSDLSQMVGISQKIPNSMVARANAYHLICAENVKFLTALSSGILKEAPYLGCRDVRQLISDDRNNERFLPTSCSEWIPVYLEVASINTLQDIANRHRRSVRSAECIPEKGQHFARDTLDKIFGYRWGFNLDVGGLNELPLIKPDEPYALGRNQPGNPCVAINRDWHVAEDWGVWTAERCARLMIALDETVKDWEGDLQLVIKGRLSRAESPPFSSVRISLHGDDFEHRSSDGFEMEWCIPLNGSKRNLGLLVITIDIDPATSAQATGVGPDVRHPMAVAIREFRLESKGNNDPTIEIPATDRKPHLLKK